MFSGTTQGCLTRGINHGWSEAVDTPQMYRQETSALTSPHQTSSNQCRQQWYKLHHQNHLVPRRCANQDLQPVPWQHYLGLRRLPAMLSPRIAQPLPLRFSAARYYFLLHHTYTLHHGLFNPYSKIPVQHPFDIHLMKHQLEMMGSDATRDPPLCFFALVLPTAPGNAEITTKGYRDTCHVPLKH